MVVVDGVFASTALFGVSTLDATVPVASSPETASESLAAVEDLVSLAGVKGVLVP